MELHVLKELEHIIKDSATQAEIVQRVKQLVRYYADMDYVHGFAQPLFPCIYDLANLPDKELVLRQEKPDFIRFEIYELGEEATARRTVGVPAKLLYKQHLPVKMLRNTAYELGVLATLYDNVLKSDFGGDLPTDYAS